MFKRELGVSCLLDLGLPVYLSEMASMYFEIAIRTALDHAATKLGLLIGIVEIDDRECDTRIAWCVLRLE
jgi:hypothetical protein